MNLSLPVVLYNFHSVKPSDASFPRNALLAILVVGFLGTGVELALLEHFQDFSQWIPLGIVALGILSAVWVALSPGRATLRWFQAVMLVCALSGPVGIALHYGGNREFQLEADPSAGGFELFMKIMRAKAPPALAPGSMLQLGLVGLAFTYRHPALGNAAKSRSRTATD